MEIAIFSLLFLLIGVVIFLKITHMEMTPILINAFIMLLRSISTTLLL